MDISSVSSMTSSALAASLQSSQRVRQSQQDQQSQSAQPSQQTQQAQQTQQSALVQPTPQTQASEQTIALNYLLMFIGGGSAGTAGGIKVGELDVMGAAVHAVDHGVGRFLQLVVKAAFDQAADDGNVEALAIPDQGARSSWPRISPFGFAAV